MKVENGKIVFTEVACWECDGLGTVKRYKLCPDMHKNTYGKTCVYCGAKNRHSHTHVLQGAEYTIPCPTCHGKGTRLDNKFDTISDDILAYIVNNANFINKKDLSNHNLDYDFVMACYIGINSFCGWQDYIDHRLDDPIELLNIIKTRALKHGLQALNYIDKDNNLLMDIVYYGYQGGIEANWVKNDKKLQTV